MGNITPKLFRDENADPVFLDLELGLSESSCDEYDFSDSSDEYVAINMTAVDWFYSSDSSRWILLDVDTAERLEQARNSRTPRGDLTFKCFGAHSARVHFDTMEALCSEIDCYDDQGVPLHKPVKLRRVINQNF